MGLTNFEVGSYKVSDWDVQGFNWGVQGLRSSFGVQLVEVINEDYNDFVSLSSRLVNVDGAVLRMQRPLQEVSEKLAAVGGSLQGELDALGQGLRRRQETAAARALLELMQDTAHVMAKVCSPWENRCIRSIAILVYKGACQGRAPGRPHPSCNVPSAT